MNADEWRKLKNLNPIGGVAGTAFLVNGNMINTDRAGGEPTVTTDGDGGGEGEDATVVLQTEMETYAIGVRSGSITPQPADEQFFRTRAGLPALSSEVSAAWEKDEGTRRPVTLTPPAEAAEPEPVEPETEPETPPEEEPDE